MKIIIISVISLLLLTGVILYWKRKSKITRKRYEELIAKLNSGERNLKESSNETLLQGLKNFETSEDYITKNVSLTNLANILNTDKNFLSEFIKLNKNKTYPEYINSLKINYIIRKLVTDPSYREQDLDILAEKSGYNSRKEFTDVFKKQTGITLSFFIEKLKKDNLLLNL